MDSTSSDEIIQYNLSLKSSEEIVNHTTHMARLHDPYIASLLLKQYIPYMLVSIMASLLLYWYDHLYTHT